MKLVLAKNYRVGSKMSQRAFAAEFTYGLRAGQGSPMRSEDGSVVTVRANAAFAAGQAWGQANPASRDLDKVQSALASAWKAY